VSDFTGYLNSIKQQESSGNYSALGKQILTGAHKGDRALGAYQFMPNTLKNLGYTGSFDNFLKDKNLQDTFAKKLTESNAAYYNKNIGNMPGKVQINLNDGVSSTEASILARMHYGGPKAIFGSNKTQFSTGSAMPSTNDYGYQILKRMKQMQNVGQAPKPAAQTARTYTFAKTGSHDLIKIAGILKKLTKPIAIVGAAVGGNIFMVNKLNTAGTQKLTFSPNKQYEDSMVNAKARFIPNVK